MADRPDRTPDQSWPALLLVLLLLVGLLTIAWGVEHGDLLVEDSAGAAADVPGLLPAYPGSLSPLAPPSSSSSPSDSPSDSPGDSPSGSPVAPESPAPSGSPVPSGLPGPSGVPEPSGLPVPAGPAMLPGGGDKVFGGDKFLVAYYGTAQTGALGVLGETSPDEMQRRVVRAAADFRRPDNRVQVVYELIVTIADAYPGPRGAYSHDIPRAEVQRYIDAAHRHGALLLLDVQPGRDGFLEVAKRWEWALRDPWVGLALDPEWRMGPGEVPAQVIGHVSADEVNRTSAWLSGLTERLDLPQKLFVLHQFRTDMIRDIDRISRRRGLALVQHVDGFGTRSEKLATYAAVARPRRFTMGFKLFYDEDVDRMGPRAVHAIRPVVRFISFQ